MDDENGEATRRATRQDLPTGLINNKSTTKSERTRASFRRNKLEVHPRACAHTYEHNVRVLAHSANVLIAAVSSGPHQR